MIRKLACILFTILSMTATVIGQQLSDVQQLELEDGLLDRIVNKVHRDTFGYFYLFFDQGLQQYDGKEFKNINSAQLNNIDLSEVKNISQSKNGGIYFEVNDLSFTIPPGATTLLQSPKTGLNKSSQAIPDEGIHFSIGTHDYHAKKGGIWVTKNKIKENILGEEVKGMYCHLLKKDKKGNHIALYGYRLRTVDKILIVRNDGTVNDYSSLLSYNNNIRDIYTDDIDSKWLLATFNGIFVLNFSQEGIDNFYVRPKLKKSEFGNIITSVNTDTDRILFLKETYGLRELDENNQINTLFENRTEMFHHNQKMIYDEYNQDFYSYSYEINSDFELHKFNLETQEVAIDYIPLRIRDLYNLNADYLLIGGHAQYKEKDDKSGSLHRYHKTTKILEKLVSNIPAIHNINFIKSTQEFWIGTQYGIYIYNQDFKLMEILTSNVNSDKKYLSHPEIRSIIEFHEYVIAGSYNGGVYVIDKNTKEIIKNLSESNGLSDNAIAGMITDNDDNVWISTFNGITILNDQLEIIQKFYEYDGFPNREFNTKAIAKDRQGKLYLGTLNGLVRIDPKILLDRKKTHGLHLSQLGVYTNNKVQTFSDLNKPVSTYNNYDSLRLDITYPDYYKYRFDNWSTSLQIDEQLIDHTRLNNNTLNISTIPRGDYNFNFSNSTNSFQHSLNLNITRDFRKTTNIAGLILLILGLAFLFFRYRIKQLRKFEKEKTRINTKIAELELTALRSQMNPHFIFNALGSVQYFIQTHKTEKADSYLSDFAKLMRNILESSKTKFISLHEEIKLLKLYVSLEKMRFEELFDVEIIADPEIDTENPLPPMIIQPFVENAINHGLYHLKDRKGKLTIHFKHINDNRMQCTITDNGIGRKASNKMKKPKHISRALEIVKDRIQTINSQADIKVHISTNDLSLDHKPAGTQVVLNIEYEE